MSLRETDPERNEGSPCLPRRPFLHGYAVILSATKDLPACRAALFLRGYAVILSVAKELLSSYVVLLLFSIMHYPRISSDRPATCYMPKYSNKSNVLVSKTAARNAGCLAVVEHHAIVNAEV